MLSFLSFRNVLSLAICISSFSLLGQIGEPCALASPTASDVFTCGPGTHLLTASTSDGTIEWSDSPNGPVLGTGDTFQTPELTETTDYYVRSTDSSISNWDFDSGLQGWTSEFTCPTVDASWESVNDGGIQGIRAVNYGFNSSQMIVSPVLDITSAISVDFELNHRYNTETCCDHGYVAYRIDGGSWVQLIFDTNPYNVFDFMYNDPIFGGCDFSEDIDLFAGDSGGYLTSSGTADILDGGSTIQFALLFTTDASFADDGWYVNSIETVVNCSTDAIPLTLHVLPLLEAPSTQDDVICGSGSADLSAASNTLNPSPSFNWYEALNTNDIIFNGPNFITSVGSTASYLVQEAAENGGLSVEQTFDSGLGDWTATSTCGLTDNWGLVNDGDITSVKASNPGGGSSSMFLASPVYDVAQRENIYFSFSHRFNTEACCDHGYVVYRTDNGPWQMFNPTVFPYNVFDFMYNDPIFGGCDFSPDLMLFAGDSEGYHTSSGLIDVSAGNTLQVAFLFTSDASFTDDGWYINQVNLESQELCPSNYAPAVAYVNSPPSDPISEDFEYCPGSTVEISGISTSGADNPTLLWYEQPVGGDIAFTGSPIVLTPQMDDILYLEEAASNSLSWTFDNNLEGWSTTGHCGLETSWQHTDDSGEGSILAVQDGGNSSMSLISPMITTGVASSVELRFEHRYNTEACCDHGYVLYKVEDGDWQIFSPETNGYNTYDFQYNDYYNGNCDFSPDTLLYAGDSGGYIISEGKIDMEGGSSLQIAFFYSSDASFVDEGWFISGVQLDGIAIENSCSSNRVPVNITEVELADPIVSEGQLCIPSFVFLNAQSGGGQANTTFNWYDTETAEIPIQVGSFFSVFATEPSTYYVEEVYPIHKEWDFDDGTTQGWSATSECGYESTWEATEDNGEYSLIASQTNGGNSSMLLTSPVIQLNSTNSVTLEFNHRYNTETCCDHGYVSYRLDGGPWQYFEPISNAYDVYDFMYNDPILGGCDLSPDTMLFAGDSEGYITSSGNVNSTGASTLEFAFLFTSDASFVDDGWYLNWIEVDFFSADCSSNRVEANIEMSHFGCTDPTACNYDSTAGCESGSCVYENSACGNCVNSSGDGVDFFDYYAPENWNADVSTGNGTIAHFPGSITITGTNDDGTGNSNVLTQTSIAAEISGTYTFDWEYYTFDGPLYDPAYYINGVQVELTSSVSSESQSGFISFEAEAGDIIGFGIESTDGCCGEGILVITTFTYPIIPCGCTDFSACNFDPTAVEDSGTCCYDNCIQLEMTDSFGDGWNGNTYVIRDNATSSIVAEGTMIDGTAELDEFCLVPGCYSILVEGGNFASEIGWTIVGSDDGAISGGALETAYFSVGGVSCTACTDSNACNYSAAASFDDGSCCYENCVVIDMFDGFGDGWNDGTFTIMNANINLEVYSGTLASGTSGTETICLPDGCYTMEVTGGSFPSEISWQLSGIDQTIISGGAPEIIQFSLGGEDSCFGCTNSMACNYSPTVLFDDGSCDLGPCTCMGDFNGDGIIDTQDLLIFLAQFGCMIDCTTDMNGDGEINTQDLLTFLSLFGTACE